MSDGHGARSAQARCLHGLRLRLPGVRLFVQLRLRGLLMSYAVEVQLTTEAIYKVLVADPDVTSQGHEDPPLRDQEVWAIALRCADAVVAKLDEAHFEPDANPAVKPLVGPDNTFRDLGAILRGYQDVGPMMRAHA